MERTNSKSATGTHEATQGALIAPEIKNDELYHVITELARSQELRHVLEIGSSSGQGSTEAFVNGLRQNRHQPQLYCMEVAEARFNALKSHYADTSFVHCYHVSSVPRHRFPSEKEVGLFHRYIATNLSLYPLERVLGWLRDDLAGIAASGVPENGIELIKGDRGITHFDMVLIDGSEFTGEAEFDQVHGARWILLDDVNSFKNFATYQRLKKDPEYELYRENWGLRNGYAVFRKREAAAALPVHFFTIVLNGEPFVRHHIEVMEKLDFPWHWHIMEGVAELKHDTAWSLAHGGSVPAAFHRDGRSVDGTSEYLDELARRYPDKVTVYRKPKGTFWDGKLEMVNAPLPYIHEECLLWQLDVDELWTVEQLAAARRLFLENPEKTAAFYYCHFFVGPRLVITSRDTYGNHSAYEWLRTWRFRPGLRWIAHEPPRLCSIDETGRISDLAGIDPLRHAETEAAGLVFQHFAYALESQVRFKEDYYGYRDAVAHWTRLQTRERFPAYLAEFLPWVGDRSTVDRIESCGITPLLRLPEVKAAILPKPAETVVAGELVRNPGEVKSLLVLRPDSIGDNVMAASMLPHLRERFPNARITVFCQQHIAEIYEASPVVDSVIGFQRLMAYENEEYRNFMLRRLQGVGADLALNSLYSREPLYDLFAIGSGARERVAFHGNLCNIPGDMRDENNRYYTAVIPDDGTQKNEMERHGDFLRALGIAPPPLSPLIWTTPDDEDQAERFFQERGLAPERTVALLPCGQWGEKIYPHYGEALGRICRDEKLNVIALGTQRDAEVAAALLAAIGAPGANLAGGTTLLQTAAIIRRCRLAVGADTGTAHIACAVGTPNVVLLGGGHFGRFFPYSPLTSVVSLPLACYQCNWSCPYTRAHCTRDIDPGVVAHAFADALAGPGLKPRVYLQPESLWRPLPGEPAWGDCRNWLDDTVEVRMAGELHASQAA